MNRTRNRNGDFNWGDGGRRCATILKASIFLLNMPIFLKVDIEIFRKQK